MPAAAVVVVVVVVRRGAGSKLLSLLLTFFDSPFAKLYFRGKTPLPIGPFVLSRIDYLY
jgi:hypothetical protein